MGCTSSDRKDPSQYHREKMLVEYLNGLHKKPIQQISGLNEKNNWHGLLEHYEAGDQVQTPDGSAVKIIEKSETHGILVECLNCNLRFQHFNMNNHFNSSVHLENLF